MRVVNVFDIEMEEGPGRDGFWFRAAELGPRLAAERIGAGVYEARAGLPIWPYHYHYPDEEWLYVLSGAPVLRDAGGRRTLKTGDVVCFPPGHRGAHTVEGPGRFVIFSGGNSAGPFLSVYPDSDKVSVSPGIEADGLGSLRLPRGGAVDYWSGEGEDPVPPAPVTREPVGTPGRPAVNLRELALEPGEARRWGALGSALGAERLDAALVAIDPGADCGPYHYEHGRELWLLGLAGTPTVEQVGGERALAPGDLACLPEGPAGGRRLLNRTDERAHVLMLWTTGFPAAVCYPGTRDWVLHTARDGVEIRLRHDAVRAPARQ